MTDEDLCVSCPICMGKYSATRYPIVAPNCGHSLCIECGKKRKSNECVLCLGTSFRAIDGVMKAWPSHQWNKNFTLLDRNNNIMADIDWGVSCPVCMEKYCATRYPIVAPNCGHSLCIECGKKRKSNVCVTCSGISSRLADGVEKSWPSDEWNKNFTLLELIDVRSSEPKNTGIDFTKCSGCRTVEKRERMKICGTCAGEWNKEWKGSKEEEICSFILCGLCCYEEHISHDIINYLPWKLNQLLNSTVTDGMDSVSSMDELCSHESGRVKDQMKEWEEKMSSFRSVDCSTYRAGLSIANTLQHESDLITQMSESCLPPLRKLRKVVTDSSLRLDDLKKKIEDGKLDLGEPEKAKPSEADLLKADYENKIQELELKKEDEQNKIKEEMREAFKKALTSSVYVSRLIVKDVLKFHWSTGPTFVDRLYMSVSHTMYLAAVDMYRSKNKPETGTTGSFNIFDCDTSVCSYPFSVLKGDSNDTTQKVVFPHAVQLCSNKQYRLELKIDKSSKMHYGGEGTSNVAVPGYPGHIVTFITHPDKSPGREHETNVTWGQFSGFHFRIGQ